MRKKELIFLLLIITNHSLCVIGQTTTEIAKIGIKSTVSIIALDQTLQPLGYGSGFIIDKELIATNIHVVEGSKSAYILLNGENEKYKVTGYIAIDNENDIIILKVLGLYGNKLLLGSDTIPQIGEKIFAIGNPKGLSGTFSEGIVSGIRDFKTNQILQITAPISPGSSGGPILNSLGYVVGIAFASYSNGQNLNFAIPVKYLNLTIKNTFEAKYLSTLSINTKKETRNIAEGDINEGVIITNIEVDNVCNGCFPQKLGFSIKNNLPYSISDITILFLIYDSSGIIVDSNEGTYISSYDPIKPFLAKSILLGEGPKVTFKSGFKTKTRILDFKIIDE